MSIVKNIHVRCNFQFSSTKHPHISTTGREDSARALLERGSAAGVYDDTGCPCLTYMVETMPDVAATALEQFYHIDNASKTGENSSIILIMQARQVSAKK